MTCSEDKKEITLTVSSPSPMMMDEYLLAVMDFVQSATPESSDLVDLFELSLQEVDGVCH